MVTWGLILIFFLTFITVYYWPMMTVQDKKVAKMLATLFLCMVYHESMLRIPNPFSSFVGYSFGVVAYFGIGSFIIFGALMWRTNRDAAYRNFGLVASILATTILITSFYLP